MYLRSEMKHMGHTIIIFGFQLTMDEVLKLREKKAFGETTKLDHDTHWSIYRDDCNNWYIGFEVGSYEIKNCYAVPLEVINPYMFDKLVRGTMPHVANGLSVTDYKYFILMSPTECTFNEVHFDDLSYLYKNKAESDRSSI